MRASGARSAAASAAAAAATAAEDARCEVFTHAVYGGAVRARVALPAHTMLMLEPPLIVSTPPARLRAVCSEAVAALGCLESVPERMLAFAAAPEHVRRRVLALWDGGGPAAWPRAPPESDIMNDLQHYSSDSMLAVAPAVAAWLAARVPEAAAVGTEALARAAATFSYNAFDCGGVIALYERNAKVAHACGWAANAVFFRPGGGRAGGHLTLSPLPAGAPLLLDYVGDTDKMLTTPARRHLLRRSKAFSCACAACTSPDALAALPCPACVPRDVATGCVPRERVRGAGGELLTHPVVVPDGVAVTQEGFAEDAPDDAANALLTWRCDTCGGVFSPLRMAVLQVAPGVARPVRRSPGLSTTAGAAPLLAVARWAEAAVQDLMGRLPLLQGCDTPSGRLPYLTVLIEVLVPLVGTAHASVLRVRLEHLRDLHRIGAAPDAHGGPPPPALVAERLRGLVPLLGQQLAPLARGAPLPHALAVALVAAVAAVWPHLRAAGLLRHSSCCRVPTLFITLTTQLVHALGQGTDSMLARPLRAMLLELPQPPPLPNYCEDMRMVVQGCLAMLHRAG